MNPNPDNNTNQNNQGNILRELSDIKQSLATNTEATNNMKDSIVEIKGDIKDIKTRYITWEQHRDVLDCNKKQQEEIEGLKSFRDTLIGKMWGIGAIAGVVTSAIGIVFNHYLK